MTLKCQKFSGGLSPPNHPLGASPSNPHRGLRPRTPATAQLAALRAASLALRAALSVAPLQIVLPPRQNPRYAPDTTIVSSGDIQGFSYLSDSSCSYTKTQIQHYTEELWQKSVNNQYYSNYQTYLLILIEAGETVAMSSPRL